MAPGAGSGSVRAQDQPILFESGVADEALGGVGEGSQLGLAVPDVPLESPAAGCGFGELACKLALQEKRLGSSPARLR